MAAPKMRAQRHVPFFFKASLLSLGVDPPKSVILISSTMMSTSSEDLCLSEE